MFGRRGEDPSWCLLAHRHRGRGVRVRAAGDHLRAGWGREKDQVPPGARRRCISRLSVRDQEIEPAASATPAPDSRGSGQTPAGMMAPSENRVSSRHELTAGAINRIPPFTSREEVVGKGGFDRGVSAEVQVQPFRIEQGSMSGSGEPPTSAEVRRIGGQIGCQSSRPAKGRPWCGRPSGESEEAVVASLLLSATA